MYSATEKLIYTSASGTQYDPLQLHRQLTLLSGGKVNDWTADWNSADGVVRAEAETQLVLLSRTVFGLKPFNDPDGHSDSQAIALLEHYLSYCQGKV